MPVERLDKDVQMMKEAGINVARMGESSWGLWEPEERRFDFAWMDRIIDRMRQAGIKVIKTQFPPYGGQIRLNVYLLKRRGPAGAQARQQISGGRVGPLGFGDYRRAVSLKYRQTRP